MDLAATHNDIQFLIDEENTRDADLGEGPKEVVEASTAKERESTQLNPDRILLRELQDESEDVAACVDMVHSSFNSDNELFGN